MTSHKADILVKNGIVLTMETANSRIENGAVAIRGDTIAAVGPESDLDGWQCSQSIDAAGGIIMPGLVNTHTHAAMSCFRGLADDLPLMTWLNDHIFPAEAHLNEDMVFAGTLLSCAEMIRSGTTCFCDMYLFEAAVARAAKAAGMRAVVGEVLYDFPSPNYGPIAKGFEYTEHLIADWQNDPLITIAVEPHSPYLCAPDLLRQAFDLSQAHAIPLVIHLSETQSEVEQIREKFGCTPVAFLDRHEALGPQLLACHCVVLTADDVERLKANDVKVSHNPESNMKLASGVAPVPTLIENGICVGLGTDGCASNNNLDMFGEMCTAAKVHKVFRQDPTVMDAMTVLRMATIDGARALGMEDRIGSLAVGKKADIIVVDVNQPHLTPMYHPESHLVYAAGGADVATSIVNGRVLFAGGVYKTLDVDRVMADVNQIAQKLRS